MITNDEDLALVHRQLERVEGALGALRRDVLPQSEARFLLMAEVYVDQILDLRAEIDAYLGLDLVRSHMAAGSPDHPRP
jgi:hypothetical protein